MASDQRGIQSVEVGGQLLRALAEGDGPMMLRDLARNAGMSAAKAHPYLVSFMRIGLVEQDKASGRYELDPAPSGGCGPRGHRGRPRGGNASPPASQPR